MLVPQTFGLSFKTKGIHITVDIQMKVFSLVIAFLGTVFARCPNDCNGKGICNAASVCEVNYFLVQKFIWREILCVQGIVTSVISFHKPLTQRWHAVEWLHYKSLCSPLWHSATQIIWEMTARNVSAILERRGSIQILEIWTVCFFIRHTIVPVTLSPVFIVRNHFICVLVYAQPMVSSTPTSKCTLVTRIPWLVSNTTLTTVLQEHRIS